MSSTARGRLLLAALLAFSCPARAAASDGTWQAWQSAAGQPYGQLAPASGWGATTDTRRGRVLVFGGLTPSIHYGPGVTSDPIPWSATAAYSFEGGATVISSSGPNARTAPGVAYDSTADRMWLFGGDRWVITPGRYSPIIQQIALSDLWTLDLAQVSPAWTKLSDGVSGPAPRFGHATVFDPVSRRLLVYGGTDSLATALADLWAIPLDGTAGTQLTPDGPAPPSGAGVSGQYDARRRRLLLFTKDTLWTLPLEGQLTWTKHAIGGSILAGALSGWDIDTKRDRLLAFFDPAVVAELPLAASQPAWRPLVLSTELAAPPSYAAYAPQVGYDAIHDGLLAAHTNVWVNASNTPAWVQWMFAAFDTNASAPATTAEFDSVRFRSGNGRHWWTFTVHGVVQAPGTLERRVPGGTWQAVAEYAPPIASGQVAVDEGISQPGATYEFRLRWGTSQGIAASDPVTIVTPPGPRTMTVSVDSAYVLGITPAVRWHFGDDSLAVLEHAIVMLAPAGQPAAPIALAYTDANHTLRYVDYPREPGQSFTYSIAWTCAGDTVRAGAAATLTVPAVQATALPAHVTSAAVGVGWHVTPVDDRYGVGLHRYDDAWGGWHRIADLPRDSSDVHTYRDASVSPNTGYRYAVGWEWAGESVRITPEIAVHTPAAPLAGTATAHADRIDLAWPIGASIAFHGRVQRAMIDGPWVTLATLDTTTARVVYTDRTAIAGLPMRWRLAWVEGGDSLSTPELLATVPEMVVTFAGATPVAAGTRLRWTLAPPDPVFAATVQRQDRSVPGLPTWTNLCAATPVDSGRAVVAVDSTASGSGPFAYRLTWSGPNGQQVVSPVTNVEPSPLALALGAPSPNPVRGAVTIAYALPASGRATLTLHDVQGRVVARQVVDGPGRFRWSPPNANMRAGLYLVRLEYGGRSITRRMTLVP